MPSVRPTATKFHGPQSPNQRTKPPMNTDKYRSVFTGGFSFVQFMQVNMHFYFDFFRNHRSKLQGPGPAVKKYRKMKEYSAAGSPPLRMGQNPFGMCIMK